MLSPASSQAIFLCHSFDLLHHYCSVVWFSCCCCWFTKSPQLTWLLMCGFIAQFVEDRTGTAELTGSNPVEALTFFSWILLQSKGLSVTYWLFVVVVVSFYHFSVFYQKKFVFTLKQTKTESTYFWPVLM